MGLSTYIPDMGKSELRNGVFDCTITDCFYLKEKDIPVMHRGEKCVQIAFTHNGKTSEKIFKLGVAKDKSLLVKLLAILKISPDSFLNQDIIGKSVAVFIQQVYYGPEDFEMKIINFKPTGKKYNFTNSVTSDLA